MSILVRHVVQCQPCERYLAPESYPKAVIADSPASPLFLDFASAYDEAVRRGWSAYPLVCPDCAQDIVRRVKEGSDGEVRRDDDPPQDGGRVPEGDQGAQ